MDILLYILSYKWTIGILLAILILLTIYLIHSRFTNIFKIMHAFIEGIIITLITGIIITLLVIIVCATLQPQGDTYLLTGLGKTIYQYIIAPPYLQTASLNYTQVTASRILIKETATTCYKAGHKGGAISLIVFLSSSIIYMIGGKRHVAKNKKRL